MLPSGDPSQGWSSRFEIFVALRYLRAKRKQAVISIITGISVLGIAAGVMALIIALAINNGFRNSLERTLLGARAHVSILEKEPSEGIKDWREIRKRLLTLPYVKTAAPSLYSTVFFAGPMRAEGGVLKGIDLESETNRGDVARNLKQGDLTKLDNPGGVPGVILGSRLAEAIGMPIGSRLRIISPQSELTPFGPRPSYYDYRVVGIFESGFYDFDRAWAFTSMKNVQRVLSVGDVANSIEIKVDPVEKAAEVAAAARQVIGKELDASHWMEQNHQILGALRLERIASTVTIGLILLVAALNILISLVMMVMEKQRDIALLISMGAKREQVRRVFLWQGALIGGVGALLGLIFGYGLSYLAGHYELLRLDEQVYMMRSVPFEPRWWDGVWVAGVAVAVSLLATLYPARSATRILPAEALRYE
ncbi:MAG: ABC transporter permease [Acidobacteria bacterium]|nr:ABC transporter permease [Acidobacteriota bacterium]